MTSCITVYNIGAMSLHENSPNYFELGRKPLRSSAIIERFISDLEQSDRINYSPAGILTALSLGGSDVLVLQELEHNVLMRMAYLQEQGNDFIPLVEIPLYIDAHLSYFPIAVRGSALGRMAHVKEQERLVAFADYWGNALLQQGWTDRSRDYDLSRISGFLGQEVSLTSYERQRLESWLVGSGCEAIDGCWIGPHDTCQHGCPSWFVELALI